MILLFGGTTEGRLAVNELEEGGRHDEAPSANGTVQPLYYYSTKTGEQDVSMTRGIPVSGAMDADAMTAFCREHGIRLLIDAAHPFAAELHLTVASVAEALHIPAIRFERLFPCRDRDIIWLKDFDEAVSTIDCRTLLATTGVQSIARLKELEQRGVHVVYRILNRESSIRLAHSQGATDDQLLFLSADAADLQDWQLVNADAVLMKESGTTGGFVEKVAEARRLGMKIYAIKRPTTPAVFHRVNGPHGLRRMVERLLPEFFPLKSGLTTGTCATAAAVAATLQSFGIGHELPAEVPVILPNGETIRVAVGYGNGFAFCTKEAGDDPDVTDGIEVRATVEPHTGSDGSDGSNGQTVAHDLRSPRPSPRLVIAGGDGVGRFTLPGFDFPPGEPAINRVPRQMIQHNVEAVISSLSLPPQTLKITISVPTGEEIARRTFNPRLGIEGGISIIGVSGIVKPFSETAFIDSIRRCVQVAAASGTPRVVINSGAKSERFVRERYPDLPRQAFVEYGNYVGATLTIAAELGVRCVTLGVMLGKAVKLAEGQLDTHSRRATMNMGFIQQMLDEAHVDISLNGLTLARELWQRVPPQQLQAFADVVIGHCRHHCQPLLPNGELTILLIDDDGRIFESTKNN